MAHFDCRVGLYNEALQPLSGSEMAFKRVAGSGGEGPTALARLRLQRELRAGRVPSPRGTLGRGAQRLRGQAPMAPGPGAAAPEGSPGVAWPTARASAQGPRGTAASS